jgi:hypothetical protein
MTQAQMTLMIRLAGGLDGAMAACEAAGFEMVKNCGVKAKQKDLLLVPIADASAIIERLGGRKLSDARRDPEAHGDGESLASQCGNPDKL